MRPALPECRSQVAAALREDLGRGDLTTRLCVPAGARASARLLARRAGVAAGLPVFALAFRLLDRRVRVRLLQPEGGRFRAGACLAELSGPARALLSAERVALNFAQRLCGIATLTAAAVAAARRRNPKVLVLDTRKTTPGLRSLEKYAVACGGGTNHRLRLDSAVLVKDNHIQAAGSLPAALSRARRGGLPVEVEVEDLAGLRQALDGGADGVLLDNFSPARLRPALALLRRHRAATRSKVYAEASGGIGLASLGAYAASGVDRISLGALTHSAPALDLSLEFAAR